MTDMLTAPVTLEERITAVFGDTGDPMMLLEERALDLLPAGAIVWEADAATFAFSFVSESAEQVLGYPVSRWTGEPAFWASVVVHPADRDDSVAYCVAETQCCRDHAFEYRATAADGRVVRLRDYVQVIPGARGAAETLRGIMLPVPG